jgi:hypothetical protein
MPLVVADRVRETSTTTGTGTFTLAGAISGYQSFSVVGNGNTTYYCIASQSASEWEVGIGTWSTGNTLARTSVLTSSAGGAAVNFSAGTKDVFVTYPATYTVNTQTGTATAATTATTATTANALNTSNNYQIGSLGVGTAASGTSGEIRATNNITAYYSDERLKTKVGDIQDPLIKIHEIKTMLYHANEVAVALGYDASIIEVGLSAQSVQAVQPEAVAPAPIDDKYLTVRYERLVPLLIEAIKALDDKVNALAKEIK